MADVSHPIAAAFGSALRIARDSLASVIFPAPCRICERILDTASPVPLCSECLRSFLRIAAPVCSCCGRPLISLQLETVDSVLCRLCRAETYAFSAARSYAAYN